MSSRMLKELKGLAPWQWDSRVTKHPPGAKALSDFEKVCVRQMAPFKHTTTTCRGAVHIVARPSLPGA